jgi:hypothetical protein
MRVSVWRLQLQAIPVPIMFRFVTVTPFDLNTPLGQRRAIIRRNGEDVEMVEAAWGLRPGPSSDRPFTLVRRGPGLPDPSLPRPGVRVPPARPGTRVQLFIRRRRLVLFGRYLAPSNRGLARILCDLDRRCERGCCSLSSPADGGADPCTAAQLARRCGPRRRTATPNADGQLPSAGRRQDAGRTGCARVLGGPREFAALTGAETEFLRG